VFYTFLVQNTVWPLRRQLLNALGRVDIAKEAQRRIHKGAFPPHIIKRFSDMLDYFGETPLVVRSSSLLEDSFGNAFSGKYESVFCMNQGDRATRLDELTKAIKPCMPAP
jgi:pyruvate, water dikinase